MKLPITLATALGSLFFVTAAHAVQINPLRQTMVVAPGSVERVEVQVTNDEDYSVLVHPVFDAFAVNETTGAATFGVVSEALQWIQPGESVTLDPGETAALWYTIVIPELVLPDSYYLGLFAEQSGDGVSSRIGSLLFLHVEGDVRESLALQQYDIDTRGHSLSLTMSLYNDGTIHTTPVGRVLLVHEWLQTKDEIPLNEGDAIILPEGVWKREMEFSLPWYAFGKYRVRSDVSYGLTQQYFSHIESVWVWPAWWIIGLFLAILGGISGLVWKKTHV